MASIGENIKKLRKMRGFSQETLADMAGINRKAIHFYETGKRQVPSQYLSRIAAVLDVTVDELFSGIQKTTSDADELAAQINAAVQEVLKGYVITKK